MQCGRLKNLCFPVLASLISSDNAGKKWRKPGQLDSSYADELRRQELAEERRKKQMEMYERLKNRRLTGSGDMNGDSFANFEDCKFALLCAEDCWNFRIC